MPIAPPARLPDRPVRGRANLPRLRRTIGDDETIRTNGPDELADLPADTWHAARPTPPVLANPCTLRLEPHVLAWFHLHGPRTESRLQASLRAYMKRMGRFVG
jgi:uncharacterized protein (DUF4415 family)